MTRIEIEKPRQSWPDEFAMLATPLRDSLGSVAERIDHIGSTAVPGLPAKDIIDIQVTVGSLDPGPIEARLATIGYSRRGDIVQDHVPPGATSAAGDWAKLYFAAPPGQRPTHLHVRKAGSPNQRYALVFRDYLRAHPAAAEAYARIKTALARLHPNDVIAYYDVKDPVCDLITQAAEQWAATTGWRTGPSDA